MGDDAGVLELFRDLPNSRLREFSLSTLSNIGADALDRRKAKKEKKSKMPANLEKTDAGWSHKQQSTSAYVWGGTGEKSLGFRLQI